MRGECWRRCRFEPVADRQLSHDCRTAPSIAPSSWRLSIGYRQTRQMAQIGMGVNSPGRFRL